MTDRQRRHAEASATVDCVVQQISDREPRLRKARARAELASRLVKGATVILLTAVLGLQVYLTASANDAADEVRDCTQPGGQCYKRSQQQTGEVVGKIIKAQEQAAANGSVPSRENLRLTQANAQNIQVILGILDQQYPEAAAAVRAELSKEGK